MTTKLRTITWRDDGQLDVGRLIANIETVRDAADECDRQRIMNAEKIDSQYPHSISYAIEERGDHVVLHKTPRAEMKVRQCFITIASAGQDTRVEFLKNGVDALCASVFLEASQTRGRVVIGEIVAYQTISQFDEIVVRSDSERRIVASMNFEAIT